MNAVKTDRPSVPAEAPVPEGRAPPADALSRRLLLTIPAVGFAGLAGMFVWGLSRDPSELPSTLIGKEVPEFSLPPVLGRTFGLSSRDLKGEVSLVNFFASWCVPCRLEHPLFLDISRNGIAPLHGINYKDAPEDAAHWLNTMGDPYTRTGADLDGRVAIDWGVYGIPETFVIGAGGRVAYKHIGQMTRQALDETILPLVERLRKDG
jgi:cytochrome c biogenesis protein CcmG/thiol:disulfide interchange protein DsbE